VNILILHFFESSLIGFDVTELDADGVTAITVDIFCVTE
jgi:hypothetical protein